MVKGSLNKSSLLPKHHKEHRKGGSITCPKVKLVHGIEM